MSETPTHLELRFPPTGPCRRPSSAPYCERVRARLSAERYAHVMRVAELAERSRWPTVSTPATCAPRCLAAVLHDVAREEDVETLLRLAPPENDMERSHPMAVHGRAGRAMAQRLGRERRARAGRHRGARRTGSRPGDRVGMAVYVADVSEPGRGVNDEIRELAMVQLERAFRRAVETKVRYLTQSREGRPSAYASGA